MKNKKNYQKSEKLSGNENTGTIVTLYGANADIEDIHGNMIRCHIRKNIEPVITGDQVLWIPEQNNTGVIVGHLPRKSLLCRPENTYKTKLIAANIDAVMIVSAPPPVLAENMIDRYLVAAEILHIEPVIVLNKIDLLADESREKITERLHIYEKIGYTVIFSSTYTRDGLNDLDTYLRDKTCVLVGASGVGKSSIIASLLQSHEIRIGEVSTTGLGKHTTTATHLYHLPTGGNLIDSPGVREFGLWNIDKQEIIHGFREFKPFIHQCKYRDCKHINEPHCAIKTAVAEQKIDTRRYESYQKILENG